ncbi:hypothetical protein E1D14_05020 [Salmonella enterica subsp. enterica serovar Manhattan]|nr:hypothetical protein [Salmonella enterica subsp. enterica serovar Manhattan]
MENKNEMIETIKKLDIYGLINLLRDMYDQPACFSNHMKYSYCLNGIQHLVGEMESKINLLEELLKPEQATDTGFAELSLACMGKIKEAEVDALAHLLKSGVIGLTDADKEKRDAQIKNLRAAFSSLNDDKEETKPTGDDYSFSHARMYGGIGVEPCRDPISLFSRGYYKNGQHIGHIYYGAIELDGRRPDESVIKEIILCLNDSAPGFDARRT